MQKNESAKSAKEIVTEFMQAWEQKDWQTVRSHISDNISVLAPGPFKPNTFHQLRPTCTIWNTRTIPHGRSRK